MLMDGFLFFMDAHVRSTFNLNFKNKFYDNGYGWFLGE